MANFLRAYCERAADGAVESAPGTPIRFTASSEGIKRDGLNLIISGARLDNYRRNPVVTWAHDMMGNRLPIGRAEVTIDPGGKSMDTDITFDQGDEFARQVERKYREGFLHAVSVNWTTLEMNGRDVTDWELLEIAAVPVPGDPDALMQRQYEAMREMVEAKETGSSSGEDPWRDLATEMVSLYLPGSDDPDEARERRYRALLPKYRRMGKTAPEFVSTEELAALSADEIRGLFLEGEEAFYPVEVEQRSGAVLSRRNMDDLRQALTLIESVIQRAQKEIEAEAEDAPEEEAEDEEEPEDDDAERGAVLANILKRLQTVGGHND